MRDRSYLYTIHQAKDPPRMPNQLPTKANPNALALRWTLESDAPELARLRKEAKQVVLFALEENSGNIVRAAKELCVDRRTLQRWFAKFPELKKAAHKLGGGRAGRPVD